MLLRLGHLRKQNKLESYEMCCWRRKEKFGWTVHLKNEEVLHGVKEERNILHTIKRRRANWIGHILQRSCLLKHSINGQISR
jgi:hypothetical protein